MTSTSEKFDCVYLLDKVDNEDGGSSAGKVPYCRRSNTTEHSVLKTDKCENGGEIKYFTELWNDRIHPSEILEWSSSIDMAGEYAAFYYNN